MDGLEIAAEFLEIPLRLMDALDEVLILIAVWITLHALDVQDEFPGIHRDLLCFHGFFHIPILRPTHIGEDTDDSQKQDDGDAAEDLHGTILRRCCRWCLQWRGRRQRRHRLRSCGVWAAYGRISLGGRHTRQDLRLIGNALLRGGWLGRCRTRRAAVLAKLVTVPRAAMRADPFLMFAHRISSSSRRQFLKSPPLRS